MVVRECGYDDDARTEEFVMDVVDRVGQWDTNGDGSIDLQEFPALWQYLMECVNDQGGGGQGGEGQDWLEGGGGGVVSDVYVERDRQGLGFNVDPNPAGNAIITSVTTENARRAGLNK